MKAHEIMTTDVVTAGPDTTVREIAAMLWSRHVSAVPVVDADGRVLGIVSEGDLCRRVAGEKGRRSWWLELLSREDAQARDYLKEHGRRAEDVMTRRIVSVTEETPVAEIAELLDLHRIKRVPVLRDGKLAGIVSRADLVRALMAGKPTTKAAASDNAIRTRFVSAMKKESWVGDSVVNFRVKGGVIEIVGFVGSEDQIRALRALAENIPGVKRVDTSHMQMETTYM
jgi:CBS domain-containing protein